MTSRSFPLRLAAFRDAPENSIFCLTYQEKFVDILHHAAIGYAGAMTLASTGQPLASAAFLAASVIPDADAVYMMRGRRTYLLAHQTNTHSILLAALASLCVGFAGWVNFGPSEGVVAGFAFLAGFLIHVLLDASNTLGTHLLWPFGRRVRLDAIFFIDAVSWLLTIGVLAALWWTGKSWPFAVYAAAMATQILLRAQLSRRARAESGYPIAIPDPLYPWAYSLTRPEADGSASIARWTPRRGLHEETRTITPSKAAIALAGQSQAVADMDRFARSLTIVEEKQAHAEYRVVLRDISMRRLGGRFGEVTLIRSRDGQLSEQINI